LDFAAMAGIVVLAARQRVEDAPMLQTPGFHHLHLRSVDPDAAIDFYTRQFPTTKKTSWAGLSTRRRQHHRRAQSGILAGTLPIPRPPSLPFKSAVT